jgi:hypothetical protein
MLVHYGLTLLQPTRTKENLGLERYNQRSANVEPFNGASGDSDLPSVGQAGREGQGNPRPSSRTDRGLEGDCEAGRLIAFIRGSRPSPCPKKMAAKAKEILARIEEVI